MDLLVRADASAEIGTGHVMRCLALAQAWREAGGEAVFATATEAPVIEKRVRDEGFAVEHLKKESGNAEDAAAAVRLAKEAGASWVVVDGYHFGYDYQRALKDAGLRVLFIDDNGHAGRYCADVILDQNIHADEAMYADREPETLLLLGTRYVLLRKEFWPWRGWKRKIPDVARKVLVTAGGSDPDNVSLRLVQALLQADMKDLETIVVVGGANPHHGKLQNAIDGSRVSVRLVRNVASMSDLMAAADLAVAVAGVSLWELLFMACPVMSFVRTPVQDRIVTMLETVSAAVHMGYANAMDAPAFARALRDLARARETRRRLSEQARELIDGDGPKRVVYALGR